MSLLAQQLRQLEVPQIKALLGRDTRKPSLLFDSKKAASIDRETFFAIGVNGLQELESLDETFEDFEANLFHESSLSFERSVQSKEVNAQLDQTIDRFLLRLSPHLQLKPAQKALEWLIQRYRVHLNNVDSLIACFLPYHETKLFAVMLQLLNLSSHQLSKWQWLQPVQKSGVHLSRTTLVNHCRTNPAFLSLVTDLVSQSIKVFQESGSVQTHQLKLVFSFYSVTLVGVLHSGNITEQLVSAILPSLIRGLKSDLIDYKASSYVVLSQLMFKTPLKESLLQKLLNAVCRKIHPSLTREALCVVVLMFQTQEMDNIPRRAFKYLCQLPSLAALLSSFSVRFKVRNLILAMLRRLVPSAMRQTALDISSSSCGSSMDESEAPKPELTQILYDIMANVTMDSECVTLAARLVLENTVLFCTQEDKEEALSKIRKLIRIFETRYSDALDIAVDNVMASDLTKEEKLAIREFLNLSVASIQHSLAPDNETTLALRLHHHRATVRQTAVQYVLDNLNMMEDHVSVQESILIRLQDDCSAVVTTILKYPQLWTLFAGKEEDLRNALLKKLAAADTGLSKLGLVSCLLRVLLEVPSADVGRTEALVISYSLLVSKQPGPAQTVMKILHSPAARSSHVLMSLAREWIPRLKEVSESKGVLQLNALNKPLVRSLAESVIADDDPSALLDNLYKQVGSIPRQTTLAGLLCEVCLCAVHKAKDEHVAYNLQLQLAVMMRDIILGKKLFTRKLNKSELQERPKTEESLEVLRRSLEKGQRLPAMWAIIMVERWMKDLRFPPDLTALDFWQVSKEGKVSDVWLQAVIIMTDLLLELASQNERLASVVKDLVSQLPQVFPSQEQFLRYLCMLWTGVEDSGLLTELSAYRQTRAVQMGLSHVTLLADITAVVVVHRPAPVIPCLLALCASEISSIRTNALRCIAALVEKCGSDSPLYRYFLEKVLHNQEEIINDVAYLSVAVTSGLKVSADQMKGREKNVTEALLKVASSTDTPPTVVNGLLQALSGLDSLETLDPLLPLLSRLLEKPSLNCADLVTVQHLTARFTPTLAASLKPDSPALQLLTQAVRKDAVLRDGLTLQDIVIDKINRDFFSALPDAASQHLVATCLLDALWCTTSSATAAQIRKVFKHVPLSVEFLSQELSQVLKSRAGRTLREVKRIRLEEKNRNASFESATWQRAILLLEILQVKKKIPNGSRLIPICFNILCRVLELETQDDAEYLKQLVLGVIHNLCHKHTPETGPLEGKDLNIEAVVRCIRSSDNPHTHQQALLVLAVAAKIVPEQLLHSMMSVFTFMGASILRQDDSYSFRVINRIMETVFPTLFMACGEKGDRQATDMITMALRVFVDSYPHIPVHRKLMLFTNLLRLVGAETYLWRFLLVFIEGVAVRRHSSTSENPELGASEKTPGPIAQVDLDFLLSLMCEFTPVVCLDMGHHAVSYLKQLPDEKKEDSSGIVLRPQRVDATREEKEIFSVACHTAKELRHFKYGTVFTLCHILSSNNFIAQVSNKLDEEVVRGVRKLLETVLEYLSKTSELSEKFSSTPSAKFWRVLLHKCHDLLDCLVTLLPQDHFLTVCSGLIDSTVPSVQRKGMEILSTRLQHLKDSSNEHQIAQLLGIVEKLQCIVRQAPETEDQTSEDLTVNIQTALYTLKLLCRLLGAANPLAFSQVLQQVCALMTSCAAAGAVQASAMLCAAEVVSSMKAYAIVHLSQLVPPILSQVHVAESAQNDVLMLSCITSLHKIVDTLPHFLSPYLLDILTQVCHLSSTVDATEVGPKAQIIQRLKLISNSLATVIPPRVLLPVITNCYNILLDGRQQSVESLLKILGKHIEEMGREDLNMAYQQLLAFFLSALDFRFTQRKILTSQVIESVEGAVVATLVTMVLKMSEATFRPMLLKVFEWATLQEARKERILVFYHLADSLVDKLHSLFLLFAAHIVKHASQLLDLTNASKRDERYFKKDKRGLKVCQLLNHILGCLQKCFLYDSENFINKERFDLLMQPLLDQIENKVGGSDAYHIRVKDHVVPAVANFAAAVRDDSLWKTLNYQLMLKTRHSDKEVRLAALTVLEEFHRKLGEDYLPLLPETIPFLAELMEDDEEEVEKMCHKVIGEMEKTLGEPLQKYF